MSRRAVVPSLWCSVCMVDVLRRKDPFGGFPPGTFLELAATVWEWQRLVHRAFQEVR